LTGLLFNREDVAGLTKLANAGNRDADRWLTELLVRQGMKLAAAAAAGDRAAAERLFGYGDAAALAAAADIGDSAAAWVLAELLVERGDVAALTARADAGDAAAAARLAELLAGRGHVAQRAAPAGASHHNADPASANPPTSENAQSRNHISG
jgi:hypothetical protein